MLVAVYHCIHGILLASSKFNQRQLFKRNLRGDKSQSKYVILTREKVVRIIRIINKRKVLRSFIKCSQLILYCAFQKHANSEVQKLTDV